jgi:hypothetical protein
VTGDRIPMPGDCARCGYPKFMHEEGEPFHGCEFLTPDDTLRKQRLLLRRAAREAN